MATIPWTPRGQDLPRRGVLASFIILTSLLGSSCSDGDGGKGSAPGNGSAKPAIGPARTSSEKRLWPPYVILGRRPDPDEITWSYDGAGAPLDDDVVLPILSAAFDTWQDSGVVRFVRATAGTKAEVAISWHGKEHPQCAFLSWDGGVAHTAGIRGDDQAMIHFRNDLEWEQDTSESKSLRVAALHEIGHLVGIGHSPREDALMYGDYDAAQDTLRVWDVAALHTIYGGGKDHADDVHIVHFGPDGVATRYASSLRHLAPVGTRAALADVDGNGSDELFLWQDARHGALVGLRFMTGGRVNGTLGPFEGMTRPDRRTHIADDEEGRPLVVHVRDDGRYAATGFDPRGHPRQPRKRAPLRLPAIGLFDDDGDGIMDGTEVKRPRTPDGLVLWARADIDGDGVPDELVSSVANGSEPASGRVFRWRVGPPDSRKEGPPMVARAILIGDLDGDGRVEGIILGPTG